MPGKPGRISSLSVAEIGGPWPPIRSENKQVVALTRGRRLLVFLLVPVHGGLRSSLDLYCFPLLPEGNTGHCSITTCSGVASVTSENFMSRFVSARHFVTHPLRPQSVLFECAIWKGAKDGAPALDFSSIDPCNQCYQCNQR